MNVLERNLELLLRRAYVPVRARAGFVHALRREVLERVALRAAPMRRLRPLVALAAALLVALSAGLWLRSWLSDAGAPARPAGSGLDRVLAAGELAVRDAPQDAWRAASTSSVPLRFEGGYLALATPAAHGARVEAGRDVLELGRESRAVLERGDARPRVRLDSGELTVEALDPWDVVTEEGRATLVEGRAVASRLAGHAPVPGLDAQRPVLRLALERGLVRLGDRAATTLGDGAVALAQDGRWTVLPAPADPGAARTSVEPGVPVEPDAADGDSGGEAAPPALAGAVRDAGSGEPIPAYRLWIRREVELPRVSEPTSRDVADARGRFALEELPEGRYALFVEAEGYAVAALRGVEVDAATPEVAIELVRGGSVTGFVVDRETGAPLEGALVVAEQDLPVQLLPAIGIDVRPTPRASVVTDAAGAFELRDLSPRVHVLRASHPERAPSWTSGVRVASGARVELAPFELGGGGALAGRVERPDGSPSPGAPIVAALASMDEPRPCLTFGYAEADELGRYAIEHLPAGQYAVLNLAEHPESRPDWKRVLQARVESGRTSVLDFLGDRTAARAARVTGVLRGPGGEPLARSTLTLDPARGDGPQWIATPTADDGSFEFQNVRPDRYEVFLTTESFANLTLVGAFEVGPSGDDVALDLELAPTGLRVDVTRADDARVHPPFVAILERDQGSRWSFAGKALSERGDAVDLTGVAEGTYRVSVFALGPGLGFVVSEPVVVRSGEPRELPLALPPGGTVEVRVQGPDGRPVEGATVELLDGLGRSVPFSADPRTDPDGRQTMTSVSVGAWRVRASLAGAEPAVSRAVEVRAGETARVALVLAGAR